MSRLKGKVAIITGAGNGQGAFEAELFAKEGATVVATDIDLDRVSKVVEKIQAEKGTAIAIHHDISSELGWKKVVENAIESFGKIDILVNNAGVHIETAMSDINLAEWTKMIEINLTGTFIGMQTVIPFMKENGGSIVNIASIAALRGGSFAHYSAAKGGVRSLSKTAAIEYARDNIRVNSIYPGLIVTGLVKEALENETVRKNLMEQLPLQRFGKVEDVGYGVLYLASDESAFVTGSELVIDGGTMAGARLID